MAITIKNLYKGKNFTPTGILPPDQLARHKLTTNTESDPSYRKTYRNNRKAKYLFQAVKTYRQFVHGVHENRLAQPLRDAVHMLLEPMSRSSGGVSNWNNAPSQDKDDSLAAVQKPMKI